MSIFSVGAQYSFDGVDVVDIVNAFNKKFRRAKSKNCATMRTRQIVELTDEPTEKDEKVIAAILKKFPGKKI